VISGLVKDTTGAVIPDAVITVTHTQSGASRWVATTAEGRYEVPGLAPGDYQVRAQAAGLLPVTTSRIALEAGRAQAVDFTLAAGQ
jgi:protocatechuate 3,4-dioxygenase beta subunit